MAKLVTALGVAVLLVGVWVALAPAHVFAAIPWGTWPMLLGAAGIRVAAGLLLIVAAPATRYPKGLRICGIVVVAIGLGLLLLPLTLWEHFVTWWLVEQLAVARVAAGIGGLAVGAFLIHAARPRGPAPAPPEGPRPLSRIRP